MFLCNMISLLTVTKCQKDNGLCRGDVNDNYKITPLSYDKGATLYLAVSCLPRIRLSARNHQCQTDRSLGARRDVIGDYVIIRCFYIGYLLGGDKVT